MSATTSATRTKTKSARVQGQIPLGQTQPPATADWSTHHRLRGVLGRKALATANAFLPNEPNLDYALFGQTNPTPIAAFLPNEPNRRLQPAGLRTTICLKSSVGMLLQWQMHFCETNRNLDQRCSAKRTQRRLQRFCQTNPTAARNRLVEHHRLPEVFGRKALAMANAFLRNEPNLDCAIRPNEPNADCSVFAKRTQPPPATGWPTHHRLPEVLGRKALATANAFLRNEPNRDCGIRPNEPNADCSVFAKRTQPRRLLWQFPFFGPSLGQYERRRGSIRRRDE